jgi:hypothetical protein
VADVPSGPSLHSTPHYANLKKKLPYLTSRKPDTKQARAEERNDKHIDTKKRQNKTICYHLDSNESSVQSSLPSITLREKMYVYIHFEYG